MGRKATLRWNIKQFDRHIDFLVKVANTKDAPYTKKMWLESIKEYSNQFLEDEMLYSKGRFDKPHTSNWHYKAIQDSWKITGGKSKYAGSINNYAPHADVVENGSGEYREGGTKIYPTHAKLLKIPWYEGFMGSGYTPDSEGFVRLPFIIGQPPKLFFAKGIEKSKKELLAKATPIWQRSLNAKMAKS